VLIRGLGPELTKQGIAGALVNPTLTLSKPDGTTVFNDDWADSQQQEIEATQIPPTDAAEAAIVATLPPGTYTALLRGKNEATGVGLLEIYDLDFNAASQLANLSTRGSVLGGDNVMIGGVITGGTKAATVLIRGLGPSLSAGNVAGALQDPELELFDKNGSKLLSNDDWQLSDQAAAIYATGVAPWYASEAAIYTTLAPDAYTAVLRGKAGSTGTALLEVYHLE
jgi:hypothetical protein